MERVYRHNGLDGLCFPRFSPIGQWKTLTSSPKNVPDRSGLELRRSWTPKWNENRKFGALISSNLEYRYAGNIRGRGGSQILLKKDGS